MADLIDIQALRALPRSTTAWQMSVRDTPVEADPAQLYRLLIIVSAGANTIRHMVPLSSTYGDEGQLAKALEIAMLQPHGGLVPARPPAVLVDDPEVAERINLPMGGCDVEVRLSRQLPAIDPVVKELANHPGMFSDAPLTGTIVLESELAAAAAAVARHEPWRYFEGESPLALLDPTSPRPRVLVVMGTERSMEGVAVYDEPEGYDAVQSGAAVESLPSGTTALVYQRIHEVPPEVRRAFVRRGLASEHALYPRFHRVEPAHRAAILSSEEAARRFERDLRVLAALFDEHADAFADGSFERAIVSLPTGEEVAVVPFGPEAPTPSDLGVDPEEEELRHLIEVDHALLLANVPVGLLREQALDDSFEGLDDETLIGAVVLKATKRDAQRMTRALVDVSGIALGRYREEGRDYDLILGVDAERLVGVVASIGRTDDRPDGLHKLVDAPHYDRRIALVCVGGGVARGLGRVRATDVVSARLLPVVTDRA